MNPSMHDHVRKIRFKIHDQPVDLATLRPRNDPDRQHDVALGTADLDRTDRCHAYLRAHGWLASGWVYPSASSLPSREW